jgi:hypothetical protein
VDKNPLIYLIIIIIIIIIIILFKKKKESVNFGSEITSSMKGWPLHANVFLGVIADVVCHNIIKWVFLHSADSQS